MEPLTTAATAVASVILTKFWEKTGEKLGEKVFTKTEKFLAEIRKKSPNAAIAAEGSSMQPLNYGQAVLEVEALVKTDAEVAEATNALVIAMQKEQRKELVELTQELITAIESKQPQTQNFSKLAEKIGFLNQGTIQTQTNTFNI